MKLPSFVKNNKVLLGGIALLAVIAIYKKSGGSFAFATTDTTTTTTDTGTTATGTTTGPLSPNYQYDNFYYGYPGGYNYGIGGYPYFGEDQGGYPCIQREMCMRDHHWSPTMCKCIADDGSDGNDVNIFFGDSQHEHDYDHYSNTHVSCHKHKRKHHHNQWCCSAHDFRGGSHQSCSEDKATAKWKALYLARVNYPGDFNQYYQQPPIPPPYPYYPVPYGPAAPPQPPSPQLNYNYYNYGQQPQQGVQAYGDPTFYNYKPYGFPPQQGYY